MQTFADYWWLYLILSGVFAAYAIFNQLARMKRMQKSFKDRTFAIESKEGPFDDMYKGVVPLVIAALLATLSFIIGLLAFIVWLVLALKA